MIVSRFAFAALCGAGVTALASLLLHVPYVNLLAAIVLTPGGLVVGVLLREGDPPLLILLANSLIYSALTLTGSFCLGQSRIWRRAIPWLAIPVGVLVCLACIPTLDPLWPIGMTQLARREAQLQEDLPLGMDLGQVREVLRSQKIQFTERVEESNSVVLMRPDSTITASAGDRTVFGEIQTEAASFPCGYRIDFVLLFGGEEKLKQRYIRRFRVCP